MAVHVGAKLDQIGRMLASAANPLPIVSDCLRLRRTPYTVRLRNGMSFALEGGQYDWFTLYECLLRQDYLLHGVTIRPGDTVVDLGANFGAFCTLASRLAGDGGRVHAYEPNPRMFARLEDTLRRNGCGNVVAVPKAVSGSSGEATFADFGRSALGSMVAGVGPRGAADERAVRVPVLGIADVLEAVPGRIALLKIDVEGAEYDIFEALSDAMLARVDQVAMEVHGVPGRRPEAIGERLRAAGFAVHGGRRLAAVRPARLA